MPPHCDSMDGPVVKAARSALEAGRVGLVLPYVPAAGEEEVEDAFGKALAAREHGPAAREVADRWFYETVVRIHRAGEGAPYTGLKPAGLGHGPVVPVAEAAIESGDPDELVWLLEEVVEGEVRERFAEVMHLKAHANGDLDANREFVEAMLGLEVWSHRLYEAAKASAHGAHEHAHAGVE